MSKSLVILITICLLSSLCSVRCVIRDFPKDFKFGVATAAYQVEGAWDEDGKTPSIWDTMTHLSPSVIDDESNGDVAADSYHMYKRDIEMLKELGVHFYRFSISWSRILPHGFSYIVNSEGIAHYRQFLQELIANKIEPLVTMYHWDLPEVLQKFGGWTNPLIVDWFKNYAKVLFDNFGDLVKFWITINEPKQICYEGYGNDAKAPMLNITGIADYICSKNVLLAHANVYHLYDREYRRVQDGRIGISISFTWYEPSSDTQEDIQAAQDARQFDWGQYASPIFYKFGGYPQELKKNVGQKSAEQGFPRSRLPEFSVADVKLIQGSADFLGVNSYTTKMVYRDASVDGMYASPSYMDDMGSVFSKDPTWPQSHSSWLQQVPWGFYKLLKSISRLYDNPPIYVTENGWSTGGGLVDEDRVRYIRSYLNALLDAIKDGVDIKGYTVWSLMDNFEWKHGYTEKFGLYEVDFDRSTKKRLPRKSAFVYKEIIRSKKLDPDYEPEEYLGEKN